MIVTELTADYYRDRPSEEILEDQSMLERLRMESMIAHHANWEWDRESYKFKVSPEWHALTGYDPKEWFPENLSRAVPIEGLLDNLISRWMCMVVDKDRAELKQAAEKFLLYNSVDNYFKAGYRIICADGTQKAVKTEARSMWREGFLMRLVVKTEDIGALIKPVDQAIAINENKAAIAQQAEEIDSSQGHIKEIEKKADRTNARLKALTLIAPALLTLLITFSDAIASLSSSVKNTWSLRSNPPRVLESPRINSADFGLEALDEESLAKIQDLMAEKTPLGDRIKLGAYDTGIAPERYQILIVAQQDNSPDKSPWYQSAPQVTSATPFESARTRNHMANQPDVYSDGTNYQHSTPLKVTRANGMTQTFFVAIDATDVDEKESAIIGAATRELAGKIKKILQDSFVSGLN
jgi:hypothetical protein